MKEQNNITVIIPVYNANEELLRRAILSVSRQKVLPDNLMLVVKEKSEDEKLITKILKDFKDLSYEVIAHNDNTSFQSQLNLGVEKCKTEWFVFLEQDDEIANIWIDNVIKYRADSPDVTIFLPMILDVTPKDEFLNFTNEAVWASHFSDEMGILDNAVLLRYPNFNIDGMAALKEAYLEYGGLKESMKLTFIHEFLLRMTYNSCRIMTIPKLAYKHVNENENGLFSNYKKELSPDEVRWWFSLAKKEYFYVEDRKILYEKNE